MEYNKDFFEKIFSTKRMERYFKLYPGDADRAILHYRCNLQLAEAFYTSLSVLEVTLRNALCRELKTFPYMPKHLRQRKNVSSPLNQFRMFRNRVFHNESICWNLGRVEEIHNEMVKMMGWINKDVPAWLAQTDRFVEVCGQIRKTMGWEKIY